MKKKLLKVLSVLLPLAAAILTALPESFAMRFFAGGDGYYLTYVVGFDPLLIGYGNFGPMLTGVLSILLTVRSLLALRKQEFPGVTGMALAAFLCSLLYLISCRATAASGSISVLLLVNTLISICANRK